MLKNTSELTQEIKQIWEQMNFHSTQINKSLANTFEFLEQKIALAKRVAEEKCKSNDLHNADRDFRKTINNLPSWLDFQLENNQQWLIDYNEAKTRLSVLISTYPEATDILSEISKP